MNNKKMMGVHFFILFLGFVSLFLNDAFAGQCDNRFPAPVAKTGQIESYAAGDDGDLQMGVDWPNPRFTDRGDGTVIDNLTGLMWLKDGNCIKSNYPGFDNDKIARDGNVNWYHALDFISAPFVKVVVT